MLLQSPKLEPHMLFNTLMNLRALISADLVSGIQAYWAEARRASPVRRAFAKTAPSSAARVSWFASRTSSPAPKSATRLDDDCNGQVDDGELCAAGKVCDRGRCTAARRISRY